ncbi:hypothetical protein THAOC_33348, partial [Thalassiosira oceanica]
YPRRGQAGVGRDDGVVRAGYGEGGPPVELVRAEPALVRGLRDPVVDAAAVDRA